MKRILSFLLILAMLVPLLAGCQPNHSSDIPSDLTAPQLLETVLSVCQDDLTNLERINTETDADLLNSYLSEVYALSGSAWSDAVIARLGGASAFEVAVIRLTDGTDLEQITDQLANYLHRREGDFAGYEPAQAKLVSQGLYAGRQPFVALFICQDPAAAQAAFYSCFDTGAPSPQPSTISSAAPSESSTESPSTPATQSPASDTSQPSLPSTSQPTQSIQAGVTYPGRITFVQPNIDDMTIYNTDSIRAAWANGDPSSLSTYDRAIYDRCQQVLPSILQDGMSDYEKEQAIYLWVVSHITYDYDHYDPLAKLDPASYTPYGGLVNHQGVCLSYATTFQLLMNLAGVECITVVGAAYSSEEDHAWNMVRLNGRWYCVDSTWDSGTTVPSHWNWFNVTSDYMALTDHQWDYSAIPEATATDQGRG